MSSIASPAVTRNRSSTEMKEKCINVLNNTSEKVFSSLRKRKTSYNWFKAYNNSLKSEAIVKCVEELEGEKLRTFFNYLRNSQWTNQTFRALYPPPQGKRGPSATPIKKTKKMKTSHTVSKKTKKASEGSNRSRNKFIGGEDRPR